MWNAGLQLKQLLAGREPGASGSQHDDWQVQALLMQVGQSGLFMTPSAVCLLQVLLVEFDSYAAV